MALQGAQLPALFEGQKATRLSEIIMVEVDGMSPKSRMTNKSSS